MEMKACPAAAYIKKETILSNHTAWCWFDVPIVVFRLLTSEVFVDAVTVFPILMFLEVCEPGWDVLASPLSVCSGKTPFVWEEELKLSL